jgi:hypothetical protein
MDRWPLPHAGAHRSSAPSHSDAGELRPRVKGGEGRAGELNGGVTMGQEAVEGHLTGDVGFSKGSDDGGAQEWGK